MAKDEKPRPTKVARNWWSTPEGKARALKRRARTRARNLREAARAKRAQQTKHHARAAFMKLGPAGRRPHHSRLNGVHPTHAVTGETVESVLVILTRAETWVLEAKHAGRLAELDPAHRAVIDARGVLLGLT